MGTKAIGILYIIGYFIIVALANVAYFFMKEEE